MPVATSSVMLPNHNHCVLCRQWFEGAGDVCPNCHEIEGHTQCDDCDIWGHHNDCDGASYCEDCADSHGFKQCSQCNGLVKDWKEWDKDIYCPECADAADLTTCEDCGELTDSINDCGGNYYCDDCMGKNGYTHCYHCETIIHTDESHVGADDYDYCESCWFDYFTVCDGCGETLWMENAIRTSYSCLCEDCAQNDEYSPNRFPPATSFERIGRRRFGVEIETEDCPDYEDYAGQGAFGAKPDCSVNGKEFYSTILSGDEGLAEIEKLCQFAEKHGWEVDDNCGLHVHFDMSNETQEGMKAIIAAMILTYDVWKMFVYENRHCNHYCHASGVELDKLFQAPDIHRFCNRPTRYEWLNLCALTEHSTFEVRLHHGSIDGKTIVNWVRGIEFFMGWASSVGWKTVRDCLIAKDTAGRYEFMCKLWPDDLVEWFNPMVSVLQEV